MESPKGAGVFIWQPGACCGGDWTRIIAKLQAAKITHVALHNFGVGQLLQTAVNTLLAAGIYPQYSSYARPEDDLDVWVKNATIAAKLGCKGILFDAELEWEVGEDGKLKWWGPTATEFVMKLRDSIGPDVWLGDAGAWAFPLSHREYPDKEFSAVVDAAVPELYWTESNLPYDEFMERSSQQWATYPDVQGYKATIPIGAGYGTNTSPGGGHTPLLQADFQKFITSNQTFSLWSFMHLPAWAWTMLGNR